MIDLHVHSTASDGTLTPEKLAAAGRNFTLMALTDHDNVDGVGSFLAECARIGVAGRRLAGVELSVQPGEGYGQFHMLGLGLDHANARLAAFLERIRDGRDERNRKMCEKLAGLGCAFDMSELDKYAKGEVVARPHIARVMMDHGWAKSVADAFERYLKPGRPAYVARYRPTPEEAIEVIHEAGGAAVMAHPRYWTDDSAKLLSGLVRLKDAGLDGVEAVYQANKRHETVEHLRVAREVGLAVTAGSDFHGANKPTIKLGMKVADESAFIAPLLELLERRSK